MDKRLALTINIDGAARGNPGPAAFAFVMQHDGETLLEEAGCLGSATNNVAEYTALVKALERAAELKAAEVLVRSDSELLVKQMNGDYRVRNENLLPLYQEANRLSRRFESVRFSHVPREQNREADRLCNEALDGKNSACGLAAGPAKPRAAASTWSATLADAERLLRDAAHTWAESGLDQPTPHEVLRKLIDLLRDRGFLHSSGKG